MKIALRAKEDIQKIKIQIAGWKGWVAGAVVVATILGTGISWGIWKIQIASSAAQTRETIMSAPMEKSEFKAAVKEAILEVARPQARGGSLHSPGLVSTPSIGDDLKKASQDEEE